MNAAVRKCLPLTCRFLKRCEVHNDLKNLLRAHFRLVCVIPAFVAASTMVSLPVAGPIPTSDPLAICKQYDGHTSIYTVSRKRCEVDIKSVKRLSSMFNK